MKGLKKLFISLVTSALCLFSTTSTFATTANPYPMDNINSVAFISYNLTKNADGSYYVNLGTFKSEGIPSRTQVDAMYSSFQYYFYNVLCNKFYGANASALSDFFEIQVTPKELGFENYSYIEGSKLKEGVNHLTGRMIKANNFEMKNSKTVVSFDFDLVITSKKTIKATNSKTKAPAVNATSVPQYAYKDVKSSQQDNIYAMMYDGLDYGYSDYYYRAGHAISREELAHAIAAKFNLKASSSNPYTDIASSFAKDEIIAVSEAGIFTPDANGKFNPSLGLTNAEAIQILNLCIEKFESSSKPITSISDLPSDFFAARYNVIYAIYKM